jgi:hypothetical protein
MTAADYLALQRCLHKHLQDGAAQRACTRTANTCAHLLKIESVLWYFLRNEAVPPTNNAAERVLRGFVIKRKLWFFTRSGRRLRFLERIFSTVQTCALQGRKTFDFLREAIDSWPARQPRPRVHNHVLARQACA